MHSLDKTYDRLAGFIIILPLLAVTFFLKFAIPLGGETQVSFSIILVLVCAVFGFLSSRLEIHKTRLSFYLLLVGILLGTQLLGAREFSFLSVLLFMIVHLPYIFGLKSNLAEPGKEFRTFQKIMVFLAVIGILQYFIQFIIGPDYAFFLDTIFPQKFISIGYNALNAMSYGSSVYKSNGFFLQEASVFSQYLALAIVMQIIFYKSIKRIVLYVFALAITFSGTGLIALFALVPVYLLHHKKFILLFIGMVFVFTAPLWSPYVGLDQTVKRATEIQHKNTSGFARFVGPAIAINEIQVPEGAGAIMWGMGAGSMLRSIHERFDFEVATSTWGKMIFEYGVIGALVYFTFMGYIFFTSGRNRYLIAALVIQFMVSGEYILSPVVHGLTLSFLVWRPKDERHEIGSEEKNEGLAA